MRNIGKFQRAGYGKKRELLTDYFCKWAEIGDSYIYDLTRVKSAFSIGTMSFDDFVEWDEERIKTLVDEFLDWLYGPNESDIKEAKND